MAEDIPTQSINEAILFHRSKEDVASESSQISPRKLTHLDTLYTLSGDLQYLSLKDLSSQRSNLYHSNISDLDNDTNLKNDEARDELEEGEIREEQEQSEIFLNYPDPYSLNNHSSNSFSSTFIDSLINLNTPTTTKEQKNHVHQNQKSPLSINSTSVRNIKEKASHESTPIASSSKHVVGSETSINKYSPEVYYSSPTTPIVTFSQSGPNLYLSVDELPNEFNQSNMSPSMNRGIVTSLNTESSHYDQQLESSFVKSPVNLEKSPLSPNIIADQSVSSDSKMALSSVSVSPTPTDSDLLKSRISDKIEHETPKSILKENKSVSFPSDFSSTIHNNNPSFFQSPQTPKSKSEVITSLVDSVDPIKNDSNAEYQLLLKDIELKRATEIDLLQGEIESLSKKYETSLSSNAKLQSVLTEYEQAIKRMIGEMSTAKESYKSQIESLSKEKGSIEVELKAIEVAYRDAKQRAEDYKIVNDGLRKNEDILKQMMSELQNDIVSSEKRYETLKSHAEEKLESANNEIGKMKSIYDKEISLLKAKLVKTDFELKSLEATIDQKTKENKELMAICDELIQKIDTKP